MRGLDRSARYLMSESAILKALRAELGPAAVLTSAAAGPKYHVDFSGDSACPPIAVVRPADTAEVAAIMRLCTAHSQPVVLQGGMTGLSGGATPQPGELAVSLERMSGVETIDREAQTMTVGAGTPLEVVQRAAEAAGFLFPLDLGARGSCTIGGNVATNAGGNQVIRFGMMRNLVLGLEAVLADGTVVSSMNQMLKNNAGYDLKQLFIGTEGTLGIVTRVVLRLWPKLPAKTTALCAVADFDACVALLHGLQSRLGGTLSAFEAMWAPYFDYVVDHVPGVRSPFPATHPVQVLIETEGHDIDGDRERMERALAAMLDAGTLLDATMAQSARESEALWKIRDGIGEITPMLQPMLSFDVSMPISAMPGFLAEVDRDLGARFDDVTSLVFGHIGDGNLHLAVTTGRPGDLDTFCDVIYHATGRAGGSVSAEHGVGVLRREYLHLSRSEPEIDLMRRLKRALDPQRLLNANRVIR
jgi:FAD/FMN-containing dehydrogenase